MVRIAILSDIHGNLIALDAVLKDIQNLGGVDEYWFLGDYCAIGSNPVGVLERVTSLQNAVFIRGNTDRYSVSNDTPPPHLTDVVGNPLAIELYRDIARSFAWTRGMITLANWYEWLADLPIDYRADLPDGTRVLLVHATPGNDDGLGLSPIDSDQWVNETFGSCIEDLVFVGHVHWPSERRVADKHIVNVGSVGNPVTDRKACYAILTAQSDYEICFREIAYDTEAVINHIHSVHHPAEDYLLHFYRGLSLPDWYQEYCQQKANK